MVLSDMVSLLAVEGCIAEVKRDNDAANGKRCGHRRIRLDEI